MSVLRQTLRQTVRLGAVAGLAALPVLGLAPTAFAAHESSNRLDFDAVDASGAVDAGSTADGAGIINYVKGASGDSEDTSVWQQSLRFTGLEAGQAYTVVVKRGAGVGVPGDAARTICGFTATSTGAGSCTGRFLELRALAVAQLKDANGDVVAQATRTGAPSGPDTFFDSDAPGEITSKGGCREPEQAGSQCTTPGRG